MDIKNNVYGCFDSEKVKYNCLSSNAINIKNMPNINKSYRVYVEGTETQPYNLIQKWQLIKMRLALMKK